MLALPMLVLASSTLVCDELSDISSLEEDRLLVDDSSMDGLLASRSSSELRDGVCNPFSKLVNVSCDALFAGPSPRLSGR